MKTTGISILICGILLGLYALTMDTSVKVDYPNGNTFGLPERVNNIGLMSDRQNYLILAGVLTILGVIINIVGRNSQKDSENFEYGFKQCPLCAEKVKSEAKICRFCNYDFTQGNTQDNDFKEWMKKNPMGNINEYFALKNNGKQNEFIVQMATRSTEELEKIITEQRHNYKPEAVTAAELEITKRKLNQS